MCSCMCLCVVNQHVYTELIIIITTSMIIKIVVGCSHISILIDSTIIVVADFIFIIIIIITIDITIDIIMVIINILTIEKIVVMIVS